MATPRAFRFRAHLSDSSPDLPSLSDLLSKPSPVRPPAFRSTAADNNKSTAGPSTQLRTIENERLPGSQTGHHGLASVPQTVEAIGEDDSLIVEIPAPLPAVLVAKKQARKKVTGTDGERGARKENKDATRAKAIEKPWKKLKSPNAEKTIEGPQSAEPKKVRKPRAKTETVSKHSAPPATEPVPEAPPTRPDSDPDHAPGPNPDAPLNLDQALRRRMEWTPPRECPSIPVDSTTEDYLKEISSQSQMEPDKNNSKFFQQLRELYMCEEAASEQTMGESSGNVSSLKILRKRKLVQLATTEYSGGAAPPDAKETAVEKSPAKQKAPKKRPRTITGLATEGFMAADERSGLQDPTLEVPPGKTTSNPAKSTKQKKLPKARAKKVAPPPPPPLLSPSAALNNSAQQAFLFGTSSQLAKEDSPSPHTTSMQQPMANGKNDTIVEVQEEEEEDVPEFLIAPLNSDSLSTQVRRKSLWEAGARDEDGELFLLEVAAAPGFRSETGDDSGIFGMEGGVGDGSLDDPFGYIQSDSAKQVVQTVEAGNGVGGVDDVVRLTSTEAHSGINGEARLPHLDDTQAGLRVGSTEEVPPRQAQSLDLLDTLESFSNDDNFSQDHRPRPLPSSTVTSRPEPPEPPEPCPEVRQTLAPINASSGLSHPPPLRIQSPLPSEQGPTRPIFELYTDAQLSHEITAYGFKTIRSRAAMIALLDRCWQNKTRDAGVGMVVASKVVGATLSTSATVLSARKKKSVENNNDNNDDYDAGMKEQPVSPSPRQRGRPRKGDGDNIGPSVGIEAPIAPIKQKKRIGRPSKKNTESTVDTVPKRRGRPKKDAVATVMTPTTTTTTTTTTTQVSIAHPTTLSPTRLAPRKSNSKSKSKSTRSPVKKAEGSRAQPVEIPDSADSASEPESDLGIDTAAGTFHIAPTAVPSSPSSASCSPPLSPDRSILDTDPSMTEFSLRLEEPTAHEVLVSAAITRAVETAPRSTDPSRPSWAERIMLYDPVVLEDMAAWLNSGQLTRVGYDGEVSLGEMKRWGTERGVLCLWRKPANWKR